MVSPPLFSVPNQRTTICGTRLCASASRAAPSSAPASPTPNSRRLMPRPIDFPARIDRGDQPVNARFRSGFGLASGNIFPDGTAEAVLVEAAHGHARPQRADGPVGRAEIHRGFLARAEG